MNLKGTDLSVSRLAFGSSDLMGRLGLNKSRRLLDVAFDHGITHFDTARSYGYGESEKAVGHFIAGKRSRVTITTKAGILPPRKSAALTIARTVMRQVTKALPSARRAINKRAVGMLQKGSFKVEAISASLASSLRELRTDYIDMFLLHECSIEDLTDELRSFLLSAQKQGAIRYFGVASSAAVAAKTLTLAPDFGRILQIPNSIWEQDITHLDGLTPTGVITHSALRGRLAELRTRLAGDLNLDAYRRARRNSKAEDQELMGAFLLKYSALMNPLGCTIFSSTNETRIKVNVEVFSDPHADPSWMPQLIPALDASEHPTSEMTGSAAGR